MTDAGPTSEREGSTDGLAWELVARELGLAVSAVPRVAVTRHRPARGNVVEYRFDGGPRIFAKLYADAAEGLSSYRILRSMWAVGFGPQSVYRVPEPLAYLAEHRALLVAEAPGECLLEFKGRPRDAWESGLQAAARWLARLHASPAELGPREEVAQGAFHLVQRVADAVALRPELGAEVVHLAETLADRAAVASGPRSRVQTHGRYHPVHVFLALDCVTVIDLDRAARSDAAKDVGEFLHRLRADVVKARLGVEAADWATQTFLEEYERSGGADLAALPYYWSYCVLRTLLGTVRRGGKEKRLDFYRSEFHAIPRRLRT
jgi:hypothetical protein